MEKAVYKDGELIVYDLNSPVEAWAIEIAETFQDAWTKLQNGEKTEEDWIKLFENMKKVDIKKWP